MTGTKATAPPIPSLRDGVPRPRSRDGAHRAGASVVPPAAFTLSLPAAGATTGRSTSPVPLETLYVLFGRRVDRCRIPERRRIASRVLSASARIHSFDELKGRPPDSYS